MKQLLSNYYIDSFTNKNTDWITLCLLHELRIVNLKQIHELLSFEYPIAVKTLRKHLTNLKEQELIDYIVDGVDKKTRCYFLTKKGHNTIGGFYSFPKVPEYNLKHHLMVTSAMIDTFHTIGHHPSLSIVQSERRQVFEIKDDNKAKKGLVYSVSDFLFRFTTKTKREANWFFEIELTMKTRTRYKGKIFPKYVGHLQRNKDAHLLYVTPSKSIENELLKFKKYFLSKEGEHSEEIFQRLHIIPSSNFKSELLEIVTNDPYIN